MGYKAVLFDLDGTLLDTLDDLTASVNYAMGKMNWPLRDKQEVRRFLGNGIKRLMELSSPKGVSAKDFDMAFRLFKEHYDKHNQDLTKPYDGIIELMKKLKQHGIKMAIVSNKVSSAVAMLWEKYFDGLAEIAIGDEPGRNRKPAPDSCEIALKRLGVEKADAVYIGDSEVDMATAQNTGVNCITVLWGFRDRDFLEAQGATCFAETPEDILKEVCGL